MMLCRGRSIWSARNVIVGANTNGALGTGSSYDTIGDSLTEVGANTVYVDLGTNAAPIKAITATTDPTKVLIVIGDKT